MTAEERALILGALNILLARLTLPRNQIDEVEDRQYYEQWLERVRALLNG